MNDVVPEQESYREEKKRKLKAFQDETNQINAERCRRRKSLEEIVFINPVLKEEDDDDNGSGKGHHETVKSNHEGVDDVERVHHCVVELGVLNHLVELVLEQVHWLVLGVLSLVDPSHHNLFGNKGLHG